MTNLSNKEATRRLSESRSKAVQTFSTICRRQFGNFFRFYQKIFLNDEKDHYLALSLEKERYVSYAEKCDHHDCQRRIRTTLQRYLIRHMGAADYVNPKELDQFCNSFWAQIIPSEDCFTLIQGEDIVAAYDACFAAESCMTGEASSFCELYAVNENVQMLQYNDGAYRGRAIVWELDDGRIAMDRIYPNEGPHVIPMQEYASKNAWLIRWSNGRDEKKFLDPNGTVVNDVQVTLKYKTEKFPYLDTLCYTNSMKGDLIITNQMGKYSLQSTSGSYTHLNCCENCGHDIADAVSFVLQNGNCICAVCYENHYFTCDMCEELMHRYEADRRGGVCRNCYLEMHSLCDRCGARHQNSELMHVRNYITCSPLRVRWCSECVNAHWFCSSCDIPQVNGTMPAQHDSFSAVRICERCHTSGVRLPMPDIDLETEQRGLNSEEILELRDGAEMTYIDHTGAEVTLTLRYVDEGVNGPPIPASAD